MVQGRYARALCHGLMVAGLACLCGVESRGRRSRCSRISVLWHHEITTTSDLAQKFFDQGLRLVYAFNHEEAIAAFTEASRLDPDAPMPYWGVALSLGPNINAAMDPKLEPAPWRRCRRLPRVCRRPPPGSEPTWRLLPFGTQSRNLSPGKRRMRPMPKRCVTWHGRLPMMPMPRLMAAEAMMVLRPWDYWRADGRPQPGTEEIVAILEAAVRQHPDHPGACHYYIHAVEASPEPQRALDCAKRLPSLMPGAGHLVHMPAHIYMRLGRYREASERNANAAMVDHEYLSHHPLEGNYASGYYAHNLHFLNASLMMEGRSAEAVQVARDLLAKVPADEIVQGAVAGMVCADPAADHGSLRSVGRLDQAPAAVQESAAHHGPLAFCARVGLCRDHAIRKCRGGIVESPEGDEALCQNEDPGRQDQSHVVEGGRTGAGRGNGGATRAVRGRDSGLARGGAVGGVVALQRAAVLASAGSPQLGGGAVAGGRPAEAEAVYREDLRLNPENGWALHGLTQSLRAQNKDATQEEARFRAAWAQADVTLTGSRF
jgi:tetratricopeptide (TPR) repeat protein